MANVSTLKLISKAKYELYKAYVSGSVIYPRVANNYIDKPEYLEHPHAALTSFDEFSKPMKEKRYPFSKATMPLELINHSISTPATLFRNIEVIDKYFTDDLIPIKSRSLDLSRKISGWEEHLEWLSDVVDVDVFGANGEILLNNFTKDGKESVFKMDITPFTISCIRNKGEKDGDEDEEKSIKVEDRHRLKDDIGNFPSPFKANRIKVNNISEAIKLMERKKILQARLREKEMKEKERERNAR